MKTYEFDLRNCDCMELMSEFEDKHFDLAIVDPPYGLGMGNRKGRQSKGQSIAKFKKPKYKVSNWDKKPNEKYFCPLLLKSKNQIVWGGNYFTDYLPSSRGWAFWDKKPILPNYSDGELAWTSFDKVLKRIVINWNGKIRTGIEKGYKSIHPTQKPVKLYEWLLLNYAKPNDKILDTHLGSMSIALAVHNVNEKEGWNLHLTGSELDKEYYDQAIKRVKEQTAQKTIFYNLNQPK